MCQYPETCAEWDGPEVDGKKTHTTGCLNQQYCDMTGLNQQTETKFLCTWGQNKGASKLAFSVAAAITLIASM